jgi:hypothetical protein
LEAWVSFEEEFIWTGNWADAMQFMDRVGYYVPFLGEPAIRMHPGKDELCVYNTFTERGEHALIGEKIRWHNVTRSFSVVK